MARKKNSAASPTEPATVNNLSTATQALAQAAQALAASTDRLAQVLQTRQNGNPLDRKGSIMDQPAKPDQSGTPPKTDQAKRFYEQLEQTGQLVDVDANTDLAALPPHVTHIRRPDGSVERIGFSASPYSG